MFVPDDALPVWHIIGTCGCNERYNAMGCGAIVYSHYLLGWVLRETPLRQRFGSATYYAVERGIEDHTGEPFLWQSCPWCGCELPPEPRPEGDATGYDDNATWR